MKYLLLICCLTFTASSFAATDDWGDDDWGGETALAWQLSGFVEAAFGQFLQNNIVANPSSLAELRTQLDISYTHEKFELAAKGDLAYDDVLSKALWSTRELNFSASPIDNIDVKIGRQVLTWGTGDYLFLNDLFAKDWQSFFAGRDDEYLKAPSDSIRVSTYISEFTVDLAWTPQFTPDHYLTGERFSFYSPLAQQQVAPADNFAVNTTKKDQWSIRLAGNHQSIEYAFYGYHGFWTTPQGIDQNARAYFPELNSWGGSIRMPLSSGIFNSEFANYDSDKKGQFRFLAGFETELDKNLTGAVQYYVEKSYNYSALQNPTFDRYRQLLTLRLRYSQWQQKLTFSLFAFYSPTDNDAYIRPSVSYRSDDHWLFSAGANLFEGQDQVSFFAQHQPNSNFWLRIRYSL